MDATHHSLTNILQTKQTLYGGGCSESMQIFYLKSQPRTQYLSSVIRNVLRAQFDQNYVIDRIHGHLWLLSDNDRISAKCACELYKATDDFGSSEWKNLTFNLNNDTNQEVKIIVPDERKYFIREKCPKYLDNFHMRSNAFHTAIETAINLCLTNIYL